MQDLIEIKSNVHIVVRERGKIVTTREGHNVFVNNGRAWLRDLVGTGAAFPGSHGDVDVPTSVVTKNYRVRYVGLGVGGSLGTGGQTETTAVTKIETPVKVTATDWTKQVLPNGPSLTADTEYFPDAYKIRFRAIFDISDVSFAGQPTYGTTVPIAEAGLFTSQAALTTDISAGNNGTTGFIAYNIFDIVNKTENFVFEVAWELRM